MFSTSNLICATFDPPNETFFMTTASTLYCPGVRRSVIVRGALPNVPAGSQRERGRIDPGGGRMVGRRQAVLVAARGREIGAAHEVRPVRRRRAADAEARIRGLLHVQRKAALQVDDRRHRPAADEQVGEPLLFAQRRPVPKGSSTIGARITRCGTSSTLLPYSAAGS